MQSQTKCVSVNEGHHSAVRGPGPFDGPIGNLAETGCQRVGGVSNGCVNLMVSDVSELSGGLMWNRKVRMEIVRQNGRRWEKGVPKQEALVLGGRGHLATGFLDRGGGVPAV